MHLISGANMLEQTDKSNDSSVYIFGKDRAGKIMFCNEPFAEIAGADSPVDLIGKTDFQMCWQEYAEFYRTGDLATMAGKVWHNVREKQTSIDGVIHDVIVNKYPFVDKNGKIIGVIGSFIITSPINTDVAIKTNLKLQKNKIYLGASLGNEYFTKREYDVFQQLLLSKGMKQIAFALKISPKTVETHINAIKRKLQCNYKNDIVVTAVRLGLVNI